MRSREAKRFLLTILLSAMALTIIGGLLFGAPAALFAALCGGV